MANNCQESVETAEEIKLIYNWTSELPNKTCNTESFWCLATARIYVLQKLKRFFFLMSYFTECKPVLPLLKHLWQHQLNSSSSGCLVSTSGTWQFLDVMVWLTCWRWWGQTLCFWVPITNQLNDSQGPWRGCPLFLVGNPALLGVMDTASVGTWKLFSIWVYRKEGLGSFFGRFDLLGVLGKLLFLRSQPPSFSELLWVLPADLTHLYLAAVYLLFCSSAVEKRRYAAP